MSLTAPLAYVHRTASVIFLTLGLIATLTSVSELLL